LSPDYGYVSEDVTERFKIFNSTVHLRNERNFLYSLPAILIDISDSGGQLSLHEIL